MGLLGEAVASGFMVPVVVQLLAFPTKRPDTRAALRSAARQLRPYLSDPLVRIQVFFYLVIGSYALTMAAARLAGWPREVAGWAGTLLIVVAACVSVLTVLRSRRSSDLRHFKQPYLGAVILAEGLKGKAALRRSDFLQSRIAAMGIPVGRGGQAKTLIMLLPGVLAVFASLLARGLPETVLGPGADPAVAAGAIGCFVVVAGAAVLLSPVLGVFTAVNYIRVRRLAGESLEEIAGQLAARAELRDQRKGETPGAYEGR